MITQEKLALNLKTLKSLLPLKPKNYTKEFPKIIKDALKLYCNTRTVNGLQTCTIGLSDAHWPLPLWFNPNDVKVGFWNKFYYKKQFNSWDKNIKFKGLKDFDFFWVFHMNKIMMGRTYDLSINEAFNANLKYAIQKLSLSPLFETKGEIIKSIFKSYKDSNWIACINSVFPLIDYVTRKLLKTTNLGVDVMKICKLFAQNGFSLETSNELMPSITFSLTHKIGEPLFTKEREEWFNKMLQYDFGIIGPALSSFIRFANIYYSYYKEDMSISQPCQPKMINRHAILHGSINDFGTQENAVKLITFLYLLLELEPVFDILFKE